MATSSTLKGILTTIDAILGSHDVSFSEVLIIKFKEQEELIKKLRRDIDALHEVIDVRNNAEKALTIATSVNDATSASTTPTSTTSSIEETTV